MRDLGGEVRLVAGPLDLLVETLDAKDFVVLDGGEVVLVWSMDLSPRLQSARARIVLCLHVFVSVPSLKLLNV